MKRINVISSNIKSIGYDVANGTLEIEFKNSGIYRYFNVPELLYSTLMNASSKGRYLNDYIKERY